jgi:hypothetical protein
MFSPAFKVAENFLSEICCQLELILGANFSLRSAMLIFRPKKAVRILLSSKNSIRYYEVGRIVKYVNAIRRTARN